MPKTAAATGKVYLTYVDQWLDTLPASESEDFIEFAEVTPSVIEIWVYAGIVGYTGTFNDLNRWVKMKFKKLDRRGILNSEISSLHADIQELRMAITSGEIKGSDGAARLASLEKELRSHIETSERFNRTTDKRGLILAGADRKRELTNIFKDDPQFAEPIENAMNAVWAKVYSSDNEEYASPYLPELPGLPELPQIIDAQTKGLRLQGTPTSTATNGKSWILIQHSSDGS